jgi:hypothetical protein
VLARIGELRRDTGTVTPIEFGEVWQSADAEDYVFVVADYPIGGNVLLDSVRVRKLRCTCEAPRQ